MDSPYAELRKGFLVSGLYELTFPISSAGAFRAKGPDGTSVRVSLVPLSDFPDSAFSEGGNALFAEHIERLQVPGLGRLIESGRESLNGREYVFTVYELAGSETIADRLDREGPLPWVKAVSIACDLLESLSAIHANDELLVHNGVDPSSVSLDYASAVERPVLFGFENLRSIHDPRESILVERLSVFHAAPELADGIFMPASDLFSVGTLLYQMIWGLPPWYSERVASAEKHEAFKVLRSRRRQFSPPPVFDSGLPREIISAIRIATAIDPSRRLSSAQEFLKALRMELMVPDLRASGQAFDDSPAAQVAEGSGFSGIAGMEELKSQLHNEVIRPIHERERFKKFGIPLINGILLYGPPGCGKTYIGERLAEEIGYNFMLVKPSDLGSPYVHGAQLKIGELFKAAEEQAPCMIFVDEIDAVLPSRDSGDLNHSYAAEVNEFLAQLANCGEREIFVLAATNKPDKMDIAALRSGRMDKIINIPPPDRELRKAMFDLHLKSRPADRTIDSGVLADKTEKYVSADIFKIVIEAARKAEMADTEISAEFLLAAIRENPPSVPAAELERYERIKAEWEGYRQDSRTRPTIGFVDSRVPSEKKS